MALFPVKFRRVQLGWSTVLLTKLSFDRRDGQDKQQSLRDEPYNLPSDNVRPFQADRPSKLFPQVNQMCRFAQINFVY